MIHYILFQHNFSKQLPLPLFIIGDVPSTIVSTLVTEENFSWSTTYGVFGTLYFIHTLSPATRWIGTVCEDVATSYVTSSALALALRSSAPFIVIADFVYFSIVPSNRPKEHIIPVNRSCKFTVCNVVCTSNVCCHLVVLQHSIFTDAELEVGNFAGNTVAVL